MSPTDLNSMIHTMARCKNHILKKMFKLGVLFFHDQKLDMKPDLDEKRFRKENVQLKMRQIYFMFLHHVNQPLNLLPTKTPPLSHFQEYSTLKVHTLDVLF